MAKSKIARSDPMPASGIFGPDWAKWRGATLRVELDGEKPFVARLDDVLATIPKSATVTVLDARGKPKEVMLLPWPPTGSVRVVRAP